ncbi:hypothetical protein RM553_01990 [Zunongwangia sp. F363]|uniref:Uncharacterized protein n=1 Tax=Autumnicola tepida TaxID=3075595 RepID=A0ABU3C5Z6_9FLAO|nr:hypothetical protein [Zunongwangia sp. F363]MDT0641592.1 hypothetical protein [Zunongwangia sp. F363]
MKKVLILAAIGIFSFPSFAGSKIVKNASNLKEADFAVYCDGVYAGQASTVQEALDMCN